MFLHENESLRQRKAKVFAINPKLIHKFRETYVDLDKTDRIDAWIIADRLCFGRMATTIIMKEQYLALQRLTRMRFHLVHNLTLEKQHFLQNLFYKCNAFRSEVDAPYSAMPLWRCSRKSTASMRLQTWRSTT